MLTFFSCCSAYCTIVTPPSSSPKRVRKSSRGMPTCSPSSRDRPTTRFSMYVPLPSLLPVALLQLCNSLQKSSAMTREHADPPFLTQAKDVAAAHKQAQAALESTQSSVSDK